MNFESELISGLFIKRYKRFFVDIKIKNQIIVAHCPNSGSMLNLLDKGNPVWFTKSNNEKRKLKYSLQIIKSKGRKFGVNTHLANKIMLEALQRKKIEVETNLLQNCEHSIPAEAISSTIRFLKKNLNNS